MSNILGASNKNSSFGMIISLVINAIEIFDINYS